MVHFWIVHDGKMGIFLYVWLDLEEQICIIPFCAFLFRRLRFVRRHYSYYSLIHSIFATTVLFHKICFCDVKWLVGIPDSIVDLPN